MCTSWKKTYITEYAQAGIRPILLKCAQAGSLGVGLFLLIWHSIGLIKRFNIFTKFQEDAIKCHYNSSNVLGSFFFNNVTQGDSTFGGAGLRTNSSSKWNLKFEIKI